MNEPYSQPPYASQTPPRPTGNGNCFLKGCLVVVVVLMVLGIFIGGAGWYLYRAVRPFISQEPVAIRSFQGGEPAYQAAQTKLAEFNRTIDAGQPATLTLTADDLNAIVAHRPNLDYLRNRLFLSIVNNQIVAETSFPFNDDKNARADQKAFFNARVALDASYSSGEFTFLLARCETLDGHQPPGWLVGFVRSYLAVINQGFNRSLRDHPEDNRDLTQVTDQLRSVVIKDNQIVATSVDHPKPTASSLPGASPVAGTPEPE